HQEAQPLWRQHPVSALRQEAAGRQRPEASHRRPALRGGVMRVYVAARYGRRFELRTFASALRSNGIEVTAQWLDNGEETAGSARQAALMDVEDVRRADAIVFFGEPHGSRNRGGGRWFELGLAFAIGKRCLAVLDGKGHESIFTALP